MSSAYEASRALRKRETPNKKLEMSSAALTDCRGMFSASSGVAGRGCWSLWPRNGRSGRRNCKNWTHPTICVSVGTVFLIGYQELYDHSEKYSTC